MSYGPSTMNPFQGSGSKSPFHVVVTSVFNIRYMEVQDQLVQYFSVRVRRVSSLVREKRGRRPRYLCSWWNESRSISRYGVRIDDS